MGSMHMVLVCTGLMKYVCTYVCKKNHCVKSIWKFVPEELKLSVMDCVTCLLKQASCDVICEFYSREHLSWAGDLHIHPNGPVGKVTSFEV
jgi:hypothetical protein